MPLPALTDYGLLPPGVHDCTLDELAEVFGQFQHSTRRLTLLDKIRGFLSEAWKVDEGVEVLIDGSFIMSKVDEPGDVDVILLLPPDWDFTADLPPFKYNALSRRMVRRMHDFDMLVGAQGRPSATEAIEYFCKVNVKWTEQLKIPAGTVKGIIRVKR